MVTPTSFFSYTTSFFLGFGCERMFFKHLVIQALVDLGFF